MIWQLTKMDDAGNRIYTNTKTGTSIETYRIYTDAEGNNWYAFRNLFNIPNMRVYASNNINNFFQVGLTKGDVQEWIKQEKTLLKSNDPEKYEKLYKLVLERENTIEMIVDPMKQHLALATVYVMEENEQIDFWSNELAQRKMDKWAIDTEAQAFFLTWHMLAIQNSIEPYNNLFQTVLKTAPESLKPFPL